MVNTLNEFYEDLTVAYIRARPTINEYIMEEDLRAQMYKSLPPKILSNFHMRGEEIASRYDSL